VEVMLDNTGYTLKPGMFARVEVYVGAIDSVIVVPRHVTIESTSLEQQGGKSSVTKSYYVYVVKGDRVEQRKLEVAYSNHEFIAVSSGLAPGELYVTVGQNSLRDSARVMITGGEGVPR